MLPAKLLGLLHKCGSTGESIGSIQLSQQPRCSDKVASLSPQLRCKTKLWVCEMAILEASLSKAPVLISLAYVFLTYLITTALYRLYFSPLAKFPGPKLAALTLWYEFYYDVVKRGKYTWKIAEMHKQYGRHRVPKGKSTFDEINKRARSDRTHKSI